MNELYYCKCLYPSTKPDLWFQDGICGACHSFDNRKNYDWSTGKDVFASIIKQDQKIKIRLYCPSFRWKR